jgi:hypothetical protein
MASDSPHEQNHGFICHHLFSGAVCRRWSDGFGWGAYSTTARQLARLVAVALSAADRPCWCVVFWYSLADAGYAALKRLVADFTNLDAQIAVEHGGKGVVKQPTFASLAARDKESARVTKDIGVNFLTFVHHIIFVGAA